MDLLFLKKWLTTTEQRKYQIKHFRGRPGLVVVRFWWSPTSTSNKFYLLQPEYLVKSKLVSTVLVLKYIPHQGNHSEIEFDRW
jgi:hypothetical protein